MQIDVLKLVWHSFSPAKTNVKQALSAAKINLLFERKKFFQQKVYRLVVITLHKEQKSP